MKNEKTASTARSLMSVALIALVTMSGSQAIYAEQATLEIVSDETTNWSPDGATWEPAIACWVLPGWADIPGATWIWRTYQTDPAWEYDNVPEGGWHFRRTFTLPPTAHDISGMVEINADNAYLLYVNQEEIGGAGIMDKEGPGYKEWKHVESFAIENLQPGQNTILIRALNYYSHGLYYENPAGLIFKALVTYEVTPTEVAVDIKPRSCPNPLNVKSKGVLPAAILGSEDFDVSEIDVATIRLAGVAPIRSSYEDVATPVSDGNECDCTAAGPDGNTDLTIKFKTQHIVEELANTLGEDIEDEELVLALSGELFDRTPIEGTDCIIVVGKVPRPLAAKRFDFNGDGIVNTLDFGMLAKYWLQYAVVDY